MAQFNIFLLLFGLLQGFLLALVLFRKKVNTLPFAYLALLLTVAALQMTFKLVSKLWMFENIQPTYLLSYKLPFLMGPLLFLFIQSHIKNKFQWRDLLHVIPFIAFSLTVFFPYTSYLRFLWISIYTETIFSTLSMLIYAGLSWRLVKSHRDTLSKFLPFIGGITITELAVIAGLAFIFITYPHYSTWRFLFVPLTLLVYWMSYKVMTEPNYFFVAGAKVATLFRQPLTKYSNSGLKEEDAQEIETRLLKLLKEQKPYLDSSLTLDVLAKLTNTTKHRLSQVLNTRLKKSYLELINDHRVAEVQQRLANPKMHHFTIAAIAFDCGFNSVSAFNEIFKKKTGSTPSKYREESHQRMTA